MILDCVFLAASLLAILASCVIFVNAVEKIGDSFNLHQGIVGSILAAVGTAMPETVIPLIAIFFVKGGQGQAIGIGAIAGAPFMLGTLAFFVTGAAVIVFNIFNCNCHNIFLQAYYSQGYCCHRIAAIVRHLPEKNNWSRR